MSYAVLAHRFAASRWLSQGPLLALIISIAAYGPLLQSVQSHQQSLPAATLQQLQAGGNPLSAVGHFLGRNVRAIGGIISVGAGAVVATTGMAYAHVGLLFLELGGGPLVLAGGLGILGGVGLVTLGGWLIYKNFAKRKSN